MDRVRSLEMLVRSAEAGSFARAAAALRVTPSAVSHAIAELEQRLGAPVFHRTTRRLALTPEGEAAYRCGREVLDRLNELEALAPAQARPEHLTGTLRVGMSVALGRNVVGPRLAGFVRRFPGLTLDFRAQYRLSEMHLSGMDVLLRVEEPEETGLAARRLGVIRHGAYAAPSYLAERGAPGDPAELLHHRCLVYQAPQVPRPADEWRFEREGDGEPRVVRVQAAMVTDDREALIATAVGGVGVMRLGMFDPALLASGALVRLLPGWACPPGPAVYALYRRGPLLLARVAAFLDFVAEALADFDPSQEVLTRGGAGGRPEAPGEEEEKEDAGPAP